MIHMVQSLSVLDTFKNVSDFEGLLVHENGTPVSAIDTISALAEARRAGYEVLPSCDNHDERGYCLGHPVEESR
jgi:hypothetical protein